jgi:hypothetical protein
MNKEEKVLLRTARSSAHWCLSGIGECIDRLIEDSQHFQQEHGPPNKAFTELNSSSTSPGQKEAIKESRRVSIRGTWVILRMQSPVKFPENILLRRVVCVLKFSW